MIKKVRPAVRLNKNLKLEFSNKVMNPYTSIDNKTILNLLS